MKIIKNYTYLFIFFLLIGFALRFINNFDQMYWLDEAYTLYLSDPSIPLNDLLKKIFILMKIGLWIDILLGPN